MAKIHDLFIVELAEVIKGYGNDPDDADPFRLSEFYRFYELPNIAVSRENFEKMRPIEERKTGHWLRTGRDNVFGGFEVECSECGDTVMIAHIEDELYCRHCGAKMEGVKQE